MATSEAVRLRIEQFARQLCEELGEADDQEADCWLDAVERRAMEIGDAVTTALVENQSADRRLSDAAICPTCGRDGRCRGERQRELITCRGPATIIDVEYYCSACRRAFFPALQRAGR
jgi:hypothetical protein